MDHNSSFDMSMVIGRYKLHSYETGVDIGQSLVLEYRPSHPPCRVSSHLVFQHVLDAGLQDNESDRK